MVMENSTRSGSGVLFSDLLASLFVDDVEPLPTSPVLSIQVIVAEFDVEQQLSRG